MIRVLHLINTLDVGGGARHVIQLAAGLGAHGFESQVVAGGGGPGVVQLRAQGTSVCLLGTLDPATLPALVRHLAKDRPDLLHLHGSRSGFLGAIAARLARVAPRVYTAHMFSFRRRMVPPLPWLAALAESFTCRSCDRVICVSSSDRDEAVARGIGAGRITVVPNGIEMSRYPAADHRRTELGLDREAPVVGMIGRLVPQKDPATFALMAMRMAKRNPMVRFLVVGDGPSRAEMAAVARPLIDSGRFTITGFREDVPELLATMDVVVFPSLWEAQGIGLIEAMAARRAVVATRLPAHAEAVVDGTSGVLVPVGNPNTLTDAVEALIADRPRREALAEGARVRVEDRYRLEPMIAATAAVYRELLAARPRVHAA